MTFYGDVKMTTALKHIKQFKTTGEQRKFLDEYFGDDDERRDAKTCQECGDTGWVEVYHPKVVIAAAQDKDVKIWSTTCVRCSCEAGEKKPHRTRRGKIIPRFGDETWHIAKKDPDGHAKCSTFDLGSIQQGGSEQGQRTPYKEY